MRVPATLSAIASTAVLVTACGGGESTFSDSGQPTVSPKTYSLFIPSLISSSPTNGAASFPTPVNDYGQGVIILADENITNGIYRGVTSNSLQLYPLAHLNDTNANTAWNAGWTGKGQSISVIDDFNSTSNYSWTTPYILREKNDVSTYGTYTATYDIKYKHTYPTSHGAVVANIAGGDYDGQQITITPNLAVSEDSSRQSCTNKVLSSSWSWCTSCIVTCSNSFYGYSTGVSQASTFTYRKVAGIAKEALVIANHVNLTSSQNPIQTVADIQGHIQNNSSSAVINLSLGSQITTTGRTFSEIMAEVEKSPLPTNISSVIVVAAGNGGAPCASSDLNGCNAIGVAAAFQKETRESTIIAGALEGSGSSENIATYSTRAGILADRFLLASGSTGFTGKVGTSFAAPRIAGAAAVLKHRYPSLTAKEIASALLLSASKDINNDGVNDFTGVHPVYGHGKLDLNRALDLINSR
jgi:hypothetical protein